MAKILGLILLLLTLAPFASAQFPLSVGLKAGVPLTNSFEPVGFVSVYDPAEQGTILAIGPNGPADTSSKNYLVGPMIELRLPWRLSVEGDALFRPLEAKSTAPQGLGLASFLLGYAAVHATTWEFPVVAKYHFSLPFMTPYAEVGPSFRARSHEVSYLSSAGVTVGGGVDLKIPIVRISPEFRYIHWAGDTRNGPYMEPPSKQDQVEFLVGFSFSRVLAVEEAAQC